MVLAVALISLAVLAPQAPAQAAPPAASQAKPQAEGQPAPTDPSKPYTVDGVRRATAAGDQPSVGLGRVSRAAADGNLPSVDSPTAATTRGGYRVVLESTFDGPAACKGLVVPSTCSDPWFLPWNPTWHQQFLTMVGPQDYMVPHTAMSSGELVQAMASSIAFHYAFQAIYSLVSGKIASTGAALKQKKVENVRAEIRAELDELERLNAAARASGPTPVR